MRLFLRFCFKMFSNCIFSIALVPCYRNDNLLSNFQVYTWGCNDEGGLGRVTKSEEENFVSGVVEGINGKVSQITAGDCHTAALTEDGQVYAWGCFRVRT